MRFDRCRAGCCKGTIACRRLDTLGKSVREMKERAFLIAELRRLGEFKSLGCHCGGACDACRTGSPVSQECEEDGICTPWEAKYKALRGAENVLYAQLENARKLDHLTKSLLPPGANAA